MRNALLSCGPTPRRGGVALAFSACCLALAGACGDEAAPAGPGPIPIDALRAEYEAATCEFEVRCGLMPDQETCLRLGGVEDTILQLIADAVFGEVAYDPGAARGCVEALRSLSCDVLLAAQAEVERACKGVFTGSAPEGGPCLVAAECAGESVCDRSMCGGEACCYGVCAPAPAKVGIGGDCSEVPCVDEAYCEGGGGDEGGGGGSPAAAICKARNDNGQACAASEACKDGQRCDVTGEEGKCYILSKEGEPCNPSLSVACLSFNHGCEPGASACVELPGAGAPCAKDNRCQGYAFCDGSTCQMRPIENEPCTGDGPPCLGNLRCENDICTPPKTAVVCVPDDGDE